MLSFLSFAPQFESLPAMDSAGVGAKKKVNNSFIAGTRGIAEARRNVGKVNYGEDGSEREEIPHKRAIPRKSTNPLNAKHCYRDF